jgi:predicted PurR-regulated permease PerM
MPTAEGPSQPQPDEKPAPPPPLTPLAWRLNLRTWIALLALGLAFWLILTYATLLVEVITLLFIAFLLTLALHPIADTLARRRIPRGLTVVGVYAAVGGLLVLLGSLVLPGIRMAAGYLQRRGPDLLQTALSRLAAIPLLGQWLPSSNELAQTLVQRLDVMVGPFVRTLTGAGELVIDVLIVLVLAYFFATDVELGERLLARWVPASYNSRARLVVARVRERLTRWVWAQVIIAIYFAVVFSVGLSLMRVHFAFIVGLVGGVLEIVPYLGGAVAMSLAVLSALTVDPWLAVWVIVFYIVVVEIESHIIAPALYGRVIGLHPAFILIALLVGAKTLGILGVFLAIPIAVVLLTLLHEIAATRQQPMGEVEEAQPEQPVEQAQPSESSPQSAPAHRSPVSEKN